MGRIFLTSDLHFGHDREFIWKVRGFNSVEEMNSAYVERWNSTISNEDDAYILGDVILGDKENIKYLRALNGNIHIVLGNHDTNTRIQLYRDSPNVVEVTWAAMLQYRKHSIFMTHFPSLTGNLEKESLKQCVCNFFGHTHQTTNFHNDMPFMYHVGVDSHDGYPVLIDDALNEMYQKVDECKELL